MFYYGLALSVQLMFPKRSFLPPRLKILKEFRLARLLTIDVFTTLDFGTFLFSI